MFLIRSHGDRDIGRRLHPLGKGLDGVRLGALYDGYQRGRECQYRYDLDLETLVCTRGRAFPIVQLASRLRCPRQGSRKVRVVWNFPTKADAAQVKARR